MTAIKCCACGTELPGNRRSTKAAFPCCPTPECSRVRSALYEHSTYTPKPTVTLTCSVCSTVFTRQRRGVQEPAFASCGEKACVQEAQNQRRREWRAAHPRVKTVRVAQPKAPKPPKERPLALLVKEAKAAPVKTARPERVVRIPEQNGAQLVLDNGLWKRTCTCPKCGRSKPTDGTCWACSQGTLRTVFRRDEWPVAA